MVRRSRVAWILLSSKVYLAVLRDHLAWMALRVPNRNIASAWNYDEVSSKRGELDRTALINKFRAQMLIGYVPRAE